MESQRALQELRLLAKKIGIYALAVVEPRNSDKLDIFYDWLKSGKNADLSFLSRKDNIERREDISKILPGIQSIIVGIVPYENTKFLDASALATGQGLISSFACGKDYHYWVKDKFSELAQWVNERYSAKSLVYTDTGAIFERDLARRGGLGFIGKNTMLINPDIGSAVFIGEILTTAQLFSSDNPLDLNCGTCNLCIDACPTGALSKAYELDVRKCISYLTIEKKGELPQQLHGKIANRIFGCDECQRVCPWNKVTNSSEEAKSYQVQDLSEILNMTEEQFTNIFKDTPVERIGLKRLKRNAQIAFKNSNK